MPTTILLTGTTAPTNFSINDITIYALTRNPDSSRAKVLVQRNLGAIRLVKGDLNDAVAFVKEIPEKTTSVFYLGIPDFRNSEKKESQIKSLINTPIADGVEHIVLTIVDCHGADSDTNDSAVLRFKKNADIE
ncbi:hypothetical protein F5884DRAFT_744862 [Xylogone sp. PMI_703]|nr:hypothetical protein F5884DRAFT_744862 [Xylogone sp. PMI_703]